MSKKVASVLLLGCPGALVSSLALHIPRTLGAEVAVADSPNSVETALAEASSALVVMGPDAVGDAPWARHPSLRGIVALSPSLSPLSGVPHLRFTLPLRVQELLRGMRQLLATGADAGIALAKHIIFLPGEAALMNNATHARIALTDKETAIVSELCRAEGALVPRERLLGNVWNYSERASTHTVETHIYRLRGKLKDVGAGDDLIAGEEGGYRLAQQTAQ